MRSELIAVTGAGGFIGRALVAYLRAQGRRVVGIVRGEIAAGDDLVRADLTRKEDLAALTIEPDVIVHLAGAIDVGLASHAVFGCAPAQKTFAELYESNVVATARVAEYALRKRARLVFASSQTVYGFGEQGIAGEETPLRPLEHYAASKAAAEFVVEMLSRQGVPVTILRFPGIFAPARPRGTVYAMCRSAVLERRVEVTETFPFPFDVLALDDLVDGLARAASYSGEALETFNLSTGEPNSLLLLARRIAALAAAAIIGSSPFPMDLTPSTICLPADRAAAKLGWRAQPLDRRLREMLESITA